MENMRWILLLVGVGLVLGIFLLTWLPARLKAVLGRVRKRPSVRRRGIAAGEAGLDVDGLVDEELEKLGQLVDDVALAEQNPAVCEIRATPRQTVATDQVFSLNVLAPEGVPFRGPVLLGALANAGLEYGDMQIFNYPEIQEGQQQLLFSLANIREPGTFDLSAMQEFTTDGLVLFMQVPCRFDAAKAFEAMVVAARTLASSLDGTIYDVTNSVLTNQTVGHMREEVVASQLQQRLATRAS